MYTALDQNIVLGQPISSDWHLNTSIRPTLLLNSGHIPEICKQHSLKELGKAFCLRHIYFLHGSLEKRMIKSQSPRKIILSEVKKSHIAKPLMLLNNTRRYRETCICLFKFQLKLVIHELTNFEIKKNKMHVFYKMYIPMVYYTTYIQDSQK